MRKSIMAVVFAASALCASAAGNYLHVRTANGWEVLDIDKVERLTFAGGNMTATDANNNTVATFKQSELESMYVDESTGISGIAAEAAEATFTFDAASRTVTMLADGAFEIYGTDGALLVAIPAACKGETVVLSGVKSGVVILKSGNYALKAVVR